MKSPIQKYITFPEAIIELANGKEVTKAEWGSAECFLKMVDGRLKIFKPDTKLFHDLIVTDGDIAGKDWIVLQ